MKTELNKKTIMLTEDIDEEDSEDDISKISELEDIEIDSVEEYKDYKKKETKLLNDNLFASSLNPKLFDNR